MEVEKRLIIFKPTLTLQAVLVSLALYSHVFYINSFSGLVYIPPPAPPPPLQQCISKDLQHLNMKSGADRR